MFDARYIREGHPPQLIRYGQYNAQIHEGHLVCAHPTCCAPVHYVSESVPDGDTDHRRAHFATYPGRKHIEACLAYSASREYRRSQSVYEMLQGGGYALINLDFGRKKTLGEAFRRSANGTLTQGDKFRDENKGNYTPVAVTSINDLLRVLRTIDDFKIAGAETRTLFSYHGHIMTRDEFFIDDDKKRMKDIFNQLVKTSAGERDVIYGAPRLISFMPTPRERRGEGHRPDVINGNSQEYYRKGENKIILLQKLVLPSRAFKKEFPMDRACYVLAEPSVNLIETHEVGRQARLRTDTHYASLDWHIYGEHQFLANDNRLAPPSRAQKQLTLGI